MVLAYLLVLLFLTIVQNRLDFGIAVSAQRPHFGMAVLRRQRTIAQKCGHLLLPIRENRQKLILLLGREIQPLSQPPKLLARVGAMTSRSHRRSFLRQWL